MPLNPKQLADDINKALGVTDKDGKKIKTTKEMETLATAITTTLQASTAFFPPGSITGTALAPGAPVLDLAAQNGTFLPPLNPTNWISLLFTLGGTAPFIIKEVNASIAYLQASAKITFDLGVLQGVSTATPTTPGNLIAGGTGGYINGLDGKQWAKAVLVPGGDLPLVEKQYIAIVKHIRENAIITFPPASVIGAFASPGAPLAGGTAQGGIII